MKSFSSRKSAERFRFERRKNRSQAAVAGRSSVERARLTASLLRLGTTHKHRRPASNDIPRRPIENRDHDCISATQASGSVGGALAGAALMQCDR